MADSDEVKRQRLARKRAYRLTLTGDADRLMQTLKHQSPEAWQSYTRTVEQEGQIEAQTYDTILQTAFKLFQGRGTGEIVDLLSRMLEMAREKLGMPPFPYQ
jgi:hypothetical protein